MNAEEAIAQIRAVLRGLDSGDNSSVSVGDNEYRHRHHDIPELYATLIKRYFPASEWDNAAEIMWLESEFNPAAHNTNGEDSRGLFQINVGPGANTDMANLQLFSPEENIKAARRVFNYYGDWRLWYNNAKKLGLPTG